MFILLLTFEIGIGNGRNGQSECVLVSFQWRFNLDEIKIYAAVDFPAFRCEHCPTKWKTNIPNKMYKPNGAAECVQTASLLD